MIGAAPPTDAVHPLFEGMRRLVHICVETPAAFHQSNPSQ